MGDAATASAKRWRSSDEEEAQDSSSVRVRLMTTACERARDKGCGEKRHFRSTRRLFHQRIKADEPAAPLCCCLTPFTLRLLAPLLLMFVFLFHSPAASRSLTESAANCKPATLLCDDQSILRNKPLLLGQWEQLPLM